MGLQKKEKITYLKISDGKIRMKTTKEDPAAEERYIELNNTFVYERVFTSCSGLIRDIKTQEHEEYGTSYSLILLDTETNEKFSLQMSEASRYFASLVMHLPNIDFSKPVEVRPYSFKADGRSSIGLTFKQQDKKVANFYKDYNEKTNKTTPKNGLEKFDFAEVKNDKEERKILQIKLVKFLKAELKKSVIKLLEYVEAHPITVDPDAEPETPAAREIAKPEVKAEEGKKPEKGKPEKKGKGKGKGKSSDEDSELY